MGDNFIGKNKECRPACDDEKDDGIYYEKRDNGTQEGIDYIIYACVKNITNMSIGNYIVDGTTQIVDECPIDHPYLSMGKEGAMIFAQNQNIIHLQLNMTMAQKFVQLNAKKVKNIMEKIKYAKLNVMIILLI